MSQHMNQRSLDSLVYLLPSPTNTLAMSSLPSHLCPQPDGVCCRAPDYFQVGGKLCEPGERPPGEAARLPGCDDGREQRQPHELHRESAGMWGWPPCPKVPSDQSPGGRPGLGFHYAFDREVVLTASQTRQKWDQIPTLPPASLAL